MLETQHLSRWYGDVIAVNDLSVDIQPGVTGLLGPNGAGKSSLMKMAVGLLRPSAGRIRVLEENPWDNAALLKKIGFVPEGDAPWKDWTGRRSALNAAHLAGLTGTGAEDAVDLAMRRVGADAFLDKTVAAYSRGMAQRFKIGLALVHNPEFLILDEPLSGVDPLARRDLIELIKTLAQGGASVLVSTHVLPDVEAMTQRILLLSHGRLMAHGEVSEIRDVLEEFPRTIRIGTPRPRGLGARIWRWKTVLSVESDEKAIVVRTQKPSRFFRDLQELLLREKIAITSITPLDDDVEALFRYLVVER